MKCLGWMDRYIFSLFGATPTKHDLKSTKGIEVEEMVAMF